MLQGLTAATITLLSSQESFQQPCPNQTGTFLNVYRLGKPLLESFSVSRSMASSETLGDREKTTILTTDAGFLKKTEVALGRL